MENIVMLFEDYQEYMNDIAEELIYRTNMRVQSKNISDTSLKQYITKECRKYCDSYFKSDVFTSFKRESLEKIEEKIQSGIMTYEDKNEYVRISADLFSTYSKFFNGFESHLKSISKNGYNEYYAYLNHSKDKVPNRIPKELHLYIEECYENFKQKYEEIIENIENIDIGAQKPAKKENSISSIETPVTKMKREDEGFLQQYLKDVYTIESYRFCAKNAIEKMENDMPKLGQVNSIEYPSFNFTGAAIKGALLSCGFMFIWFWLTGDFFSDLTISLVLIFALLGFCPILFLEIKKFKAKQKEVLEQREAQNHRLLKDQQRLQKYIQRIKPFKDIVSSSGNTLKKLYDMNVIFEKYRDFISVSQLYEYVSSGRCNELEGSDGAYNLYERDLCFNLINTDVNTIVGQAENIRFNQMMVYSAIQELNTLLSKISNVSAITEYSNSVLNNNNLFLNKYF